MAQKIDIEKATFAAGCFWGVEVIFRRLDGVISTEVGYTGGAMPNPSYRDVCTGGTGHAEAVRIEFDPAIITYDELLDVFWTHHDPTELNRQGPDIGTQYRSAIFYHSPRQKEAAINSKAEIEKLKMYKAPIVTEIVPAATFYRAEEYHQQYMEKHDFPSCGAPCRKAI